MNLRPGNDDMDRRDLPAHAASKASRVAWARKAIPDGAAPMAAAASRGRRARPVHRANPDHKARVANRGRRASRARRVLSAPAAKPDRPGSCRRSSR